MIVLEAENKMFFFQNKIANYKTNKQIQLSNIQHNIKHIWIKKLILKYKKKKNSTMFTMIVRT